MIVATVLAIAVVAAVYFIASSIFRNTMIDRKLAKVPGPTGALPYLGHAFQLVGAKPWNVMKNWAADNGTICKFMILGQRVVYTNDPKFIKRILLTNQRNYNKDVAMSYKHFMCLLGKGLVTSEGEHWRRGRILLSHALRIDILDEVPEIALSAVKRLLTKMENNAVVDLNEEYRHLTLQVISEAALSFTHEESDAIFPALYLPIVHECNKRTFYPYRVFMPWLQGFRERRDCLKKLNGVLCETIRTRWAKRQDEEAKGIKRKQDIMDTCMSQLQDLPDSMVQQLRDDIKTMLLAGHETSAALLTWATFELMKSPAVHAEVVREAEEVFGQCIRDDVTPTMEHVNKLRWTPAVLKETLRLHSVVPLTMRVAMNDDVIPRDATGLGHDIVIPKGCTVAVGIDGVHHRADIFPEPNSFRPERFLDAAADEIDPYAFIPFINGPRNCLGQHLALAETQIVLAYVMYHRALSLPKAGEHTMEELGQHDDFIVPSVPKYGLNVSSTPRTPLSH